MKLRFIISILLVMTIPCFGMIHKPVYLQDTLNYSISVNLRMVPEIMKFKNRYNILSSVNYDYGNVEISYEVQGRLSETTYTDSSLLSSSRFLNDRREEFSMPDIPEKRLFYGVWRDQLTKSTSETDIARSVTEGTHGLIELGYSDFKNDFLPFITMLMEENHIVTYDFGRTKGFGNSSLGIVPSNVLLNALRSMDPSVKAGVCRDVHETGRELLKTMSQVYYEHFYPGSDIDFDDFIFLQSWATDASQHVTLSLIDPFNTSMVYELDWGRVIEEKSVPGYINGRLYGNTFRIWKYDKIRKLTVPVDFRRTQFGRIFDFTILTDEEYMRFNGVDDEKSFSDVSMKINTKKTGAYSISAGTFHPYQKYLLSGWKLDMKKKNLGNFLSHSFTFALQAAIGEDTHRKQYFYPDKEWQYTSSLMGIPRVLSWFRTPEFRIGRSLTFDAFLYQQFDVFLILNSFTEKASGLYWTKSGDANLSFSNGFNINYIPDGIFTGLFSLQARSCLLPEDIRLLTPNAAGLLPHVRFITPAVDAITSISLKPGNELSLKMNSVFEFTSLNSILFSGTVSGTKSYDNGLSVSLTGGSAGIVKGMQYYWYPAPRKWIDLQLTLKNSSIIVGLHRYQQSNPNTCVSFIRHFN